MRATLRRVGPCAFAAEVPSGGRVTVDGSSELAARIVERAAPGTIPTSTAAPSSGALRPMELFLVSLAGCAAMDVALIVTRQREPLGELRVDVEGVRADATPAVFERVTLRFSAPPSAAGAVDAAKLARACELSVRKYCSVASMLAPRVEIVIETSVAP